MLRMQREFRCYKSARVEAAVEALDNGASFEEVPIREYFSVDTSPTRDKVGENLTFWMR